MSSLVTAPAIESSDLADLSALLRHAERGCWAFALYNTVAVRDEVVAALRASLAPLPVFEFTASPYNPNPLAYLERLPDEARSQRAMVFLYDVDQVGDKTWGYLDLNREAFAGYPHGLVFWITPAGRKAVAQHAPNFWAQRSGVFDFTIPSPEALAEVQHAWASQPVRIESAQDIERQIRLYAGLLREYQAAQSQPEAQAGLHNKLGRLHEFIGRYDEAREHWQNQLELGQQLGDEEMQAGALHNLGVLAQDQGDYPAARDLYTQSLDIERRLGNQAGIAQTLHQLGLLAQAQGDYPAARDLYTQSLDINRRLGNQADIAQTLHNLGAIAQDQGDYSAARDLYAQSLDITRRLGDQAVIAQTLHNLGVLAQQQGDYAAARDLYTQSLDIKQRLGNQAGIAQTLAQLALLEEKEGNAPRALELIRQAEAIFVQLHSPYAEQAQRDRKRLEVVNSE